MIVKNYKNHLILSSKTIRNAIIKLGKLNQKFCVIIDKNKKFYGTLTDGDIRRMLEGGGDIMNLQAKDIMCTNPKQIQADELAAVALKIMEEHNITQLLVMEGTSYISIVHLHDILKEGII